MSKESVVFSSRAEHSLSVLRAWVMQRARTGSRRLLFSSCWRGEGTTTVVARLVLALAQISVKVAVFDLDYRTRRLSDYLQKCRGVDISCGPKLFWTAGLAAGQGLEELRSGAFEAVRREAEEWADVVIYDCPALSVSREVFLVPGYFDGAVLVSHVDRLEGYPEASLSEELRDHSIDLLGVIQTGV